MPSGGRPAAEISAAASLMFDVRWGASDALPLPVVRMWYLSIWPYPGRVMAV